MAIRLWPQDYERKEHITKAEKVLLKNAFRNFKDGHLVVDIDPVGMSSATVRMGMYISPQEGLITFSFYSGEVSLPMVDSYRVYVDMVEEKIYSRLLNSKILIARSGDCKILKFPYKHIIIFSDEKVGRFSDKEDQISRLENYAALGFFRPITSVGKEKTIKDLGIFQGVRKPYDKAFSEITEMECRAIFERLAPEYTVVMTETENVQVKETKTAVTDQDFRITGKEVEYKSFFLDEYQVAQVNDMGTGHRVILANPGAGKSVLLLSKAFRYASLYKDSKVLLTCYNNNLADAYNFKRACANFGSNNNLFIMTFHRFVKKIYDECLHVKTSSNIVSDEEIQKCIDYIRAGKINLKFKAIFIDEVQNFDPRFLELCYLLLEPGEFSTFLMAGDLNQAVRKQSRHGDVPWKRINGVKLDFTGRVKYIEKNYRNSREIGEYLYEMLILMNDRLSMFGLINSMEYEYNSFTMGEKPTEALVVKPGVNRMQIIKSVVNSIREIVERHNTSYSDVAVLFPYRKRAYLKYNFLYWLEEALKEAGIPYSKIIASEDDPNGRTRYSDTRGVVLSTIESSLGLDFKAVILAGLLPYNYVFPSENKTVEIKSWTAIKRMSEDEQDLVQSQMRSIYTACSRARDILYVLSDLKAGSPMEELLTKNTSPALKYSVDSLSKKEYEKLSVRSERSGAPSGKIASKECSSVTDHVKVQVVILETKRITSLIIDVAKYPRQKVILGKCVGDTFKFEGMPYTYQIIKIMDI